MVTNFTIKTITVGVVVAVVAAVSYFFIKRDEEHEARHQEKLAKLRIKH